jgi:hypothetical protein
MKERRKRGERVQEVKVFVCGKREGGENSGFRGGADAN